MSAEGTSQMITFDEAMRARDMAAVCDLKTDAIDIGDAVNLILQRSEIIRDQPRHNRYIRAWMRGDDGPIRDLIGQMGIEELTRRAAAFIYLEYLELRPVFEVKRPTNIADIGCGYALFDLFLAQDYGCDIALIDLESSDNRHFGFEDQGAAYSSLAVARRLLEDNKIASDTIRTLNPEKDSLEALSNLDYAFSFISCGYHYPWTTYRSFFEDRLAPDGHIILDLRSKTLGDAVLELSDFGYMRALTRAANDSAHRVMVLKHAVFEQDPGFLPAKK